jgi:hypothetical protein
MATDATFDTYANAPSIREDLMDVIYNISPTDTPFVSNVGTGSSKGTYHEWQKDTLAAPEDNPVIEGADATPVALAPTVRLGNYCQINEKTWVISGTDLVADNAGKGVDMAYHEAKKGLELRKDVEYVCVAVNKGSDAGAGWAGTEAARQTGTVMAWLNTNTEFDAVGTGGAPGADPTTEDGANARTDSTATTLRTFTEAMLTSVIDDIYIQGGDPDVIMCNTAQKRAISGSGGGDGFKGSADENKNDVMRKRIINAVDFYESDYGVLAVTPNRYMRQRDVFVLDTDMWEVAYHRPFQTSDLAKTGDNEKKQMIVEWTLVSKEEASSGGIFDLAG